MHLYLQHLSALTMRNLPRYLWILVDGMNELTSRGKRFGRIEISETNNLFHNQINIESSDHVGSVILDISLFDKVVAQRFGA